jgi:hypothetical protein
MNRAIVVASPIQNESFAAKSAIAALRRPWILAILSTAAIWYAADGLRAGRGFERADFSSYYMWAYAARHNLNPYIVDFEPIAASLHLRTDGMDHADYPPTFILMFEPLTALSPRAAYRLWIGLSAAAFAAALILLLGGDSGLDFRIRIAMAALAILFYPIRVHFNWAQTQLVLLPMLIIADRLLERGRYKVAGFIVALAGLIKIFPLFICGYLIAERRWRAMSFTAIGLAAGSVATIALLGIPSSAAFGARLAEVFTGGWLARHGKADSVELVSMSTFVSRMVAGIIGVHSGAMFDATRVIAITLAVTAILLGAARATRATIGDPGRRRRSFALWIVTMVLLSPTAWIHYMVLLLVPYAELVIAANRGAASRRAIWAGAASYGLTQLSSAAFAAFQTLLPMAIVMPMAQCWFPCATLLAYASAYWLATDCV